MFFNVFNSVSAFSRLLCSNDNEASKLLLYPFRAVMFEFSFWIVFGAGGILRG